MKALIILGIILVLSVGLAHGQAGYIGLFTDAGAINCDVIDGGTGVVEIYIIHMASAGATAAQFKVEGGGGMNMMWVSDHYTWICIDCGTTQEGIVVPYLGGCKSSPFVLLSMTYFSMATSAVCSYLDVVADPDAASGTIEIVDCSSTMHTAGGSRMYVNPDGSCSCNVATKQSHWGGIKALYVE